MNIKKHVSVERCKKIPVVFLLLTAWIFWGPGADAQNMDFLDRIVHPEGELFLTKGDLETIPVKSPTRISIVDPEVADIVEAGNEGVLVIAKAPGETPLFIWEEGKKRIVMIRVVDKNLEGVNARLEKLFEATGITGVDREINEKEGKIVLTGYLSEKAKGDFDQLVEPFGSFLINMVKKQDVKDLIQIDMQITELDSTLLKELGIQWGTQGQGTSANELLHTYTETLPDMDGTIGDFFKIGEFRRVTGLQAIVHTMIQEGRARVLSQPKLVVVNGEEASFLVGGQIPVRTTSSNGDTTIQNVSYKDYGVSLSITPTIEEKDKIAINLNIQISDIDASVDVGEDIAFTTQTASTRLLLNDRQTIILAGLIKHNESENISRVPFLSKLPVFGMIFRYKGHTTPAKDQELVLSLTPKILEKNRSSKEKQGEGEREEYKTTAVLTQTISSPGEKASKVKPYYLGIPKDMTAYAGNIQKKIASGVMYPEEGRPQGWEGTVKLNMLILRDGTLAYAVVQESSGNDSLDNAALLAAKQNAPYDVFPPDVKLQELNVLVPVVYRLKK